MKFKLRFWVTFIVTLFVIGCDDYDDTDITNRVDNLEGRVERLEQLCDQMNTNINSLQRIVDALQQYDHITSVTPVKQGDETIGYTIAFSKGTPITIYHGEDGINGVNGKNGTTPTIGVKDFEGVYYWTVNGEWLLDGEGEKIRAEAKDGLNGANGSTPTLEIREDGNWYVSYNGKEYIKLGQAVGEKGDPGEDAISFFQNIDVTNSNYVIFTLSDSTQIKLPTWSAYEDLKELYNEMNSNINALQIIMEGVDYIVSVDPVFDENRDKIGYSISFAKRPSITIYHGEKGETGVPRISVKDTLNSYYWTIDDEWLKDQDGNLVKAKGEDGVTPQFQINDTTGHWEVSYDEKATWEDLGVLAKGEKGDSFFKSVEQDTTTGEWVFILNDNDDDDANNPTFTLPMHKPLTISFTYKGSTIANNFIEIMAGTVAPEIDYVVEGCTDYSIEIISNWEAIAKDGKISITFPNVIEINATNKLIVLVSDRKGHTTMESLTVKYIKNNYKIGDLYDNEGSKGVIFWISDDYRFAKIASLDETSLKWYDKEKNGGMEVGNFGMTNENDGLANIEAKNNHSYASYANKGLLALNWCTAKGEGWYLPAINELIMILNARSQMNTTLSANSATSISTDNYWSSTAKDYDDVYTYGSSKSYANYGRKRLVRAIKNVEIKL